MRKKTSKWLRRLFLYPLLIPASYFVISLVLSYIPYNRSFDFKDGEKEIYISTNGVHLDIIIPKNDISDELLLGLDLQDDVRFYSFGWGDENFYINTPTWDDLTFSNAMEAMFLKSSTLMHVTNYNKENAKWIKIKCTQEELNLLQSHILSSFHHDKSGNKQMLVDDGYSSSDFFFRANGSYSCLKTCNSWVNDVLKKSGMKSCVWTPFDFGVMWQYSD
jgi:uncharacterized protein (TIGR02117 family)